MKTFEVTFSASIEAANAEDAEELLIELLESDPAIESWHIQRPETAVV